VEAVPAGGAEATAATRATIRRRTDALTGRASAAHSPAMAATWATEVLALAHGDLLAGY